MNTTAHRLRCGDTARRVSFVVHLPTLDESEELAPVYALETPES